MNRRRSSALLLGTILVLAYIVLRTHLSDRKSAARRHQEELIALYNEMPLSDRAAADSFLNNVQPDWHEQLNGFAKDQRRELNKDTFMHIQVAIQPNLKPIPIVNGQFRIVVPQPPVDAAPPLTPVQQAIILKRARSIGRIEVYLGGEYELKGTAFMVAPETVATNCHVARTLLSSIRPFTLMSAGDILIDFGDTPSHLASSEFRIMSLAPCPGTGLDVAFMRISEKAVDGLSVPPDYLSFIRSMPAAIKDQKTVDIGEIGFPDLKSVQGGTPTQDLFKLYDKTKYSKFYTPGAVTSTESVNGVDFVYHVTSTWPGESGSPMFDLNTLEVLGVDTCCDRFGGQLPTPSDLSCATRLLTAPANLGVASWTIFNDAVLGPLLPRP
jgi:Trypsin-like peptidase domain